ncbi:tricarballylate/proton symporter TcuC [Asaia prunellae]|uniref:tricarballylate/proton symporter TcuC n=1 Tax=Asaia prunellae TaxID=610245 RepID=UPI000472B82C|nr:tricarballylate/proton symporter TcuC [Asaia prunellae]
MTETDFPVENVSRRSILTNALRAASGNFLEMYDFSVFGYYAEYIAHAFFPGASPAASLMMVFATFGAAFLMRPLGALVLGTYVDRIGVRRGLILTLSLMAFGTLMLALTPSYRRIGLLAPLLVLFGRLVQGFSAGAEVGSTSVYLSALAPPRWRGLLVAFQSASQQVAVMFAALVGVVLSGHLTSEQMDQWGWRVPLLIGCVIVPLLFLLRRSLAEPEASGAHARTGHGVAVTFVKLLRNWRLAVSGCLMVFMTTVSFYMITAYTPSYGSAVLHLSSTTGLTVTFFVGLSNLVWLLVSGALSDRIGRRPIMAGATIASILTVYPALCWLTAAPSFTRMLVTLLWLSCLYGLYNGALVVFLTEYVPKEIRTAGFSVVYSLATCVGGFTPALCTLLIHHTGNRAIPGLWMSVAALISLLAIPRKSRSVSHLVLLILILGITGSFQPRQAQAQAINGGLALSPSLALATPLAPDLPFFPGIMMPVVHPIYGDPWHLRNRLRDRGIDVLLDMRNEFSANATGGTRRTSSMVNQLGLETDIDWNRLARIPGLSTSVVVVNRSGANTSPNFGDSFVRSQDILRSSSGGAAAHLVLAYAEEKIAHGRLAIQLGREPVALNFAASPLNCAFMTNAICGNPKVLTGRDPGFSVYPNSTWAGRIIAYPLRNLYVQAGLFAYDPGSDAGPKFNHTGWQLNSSRLTGTTSVGEIGYIPSFGPHRLIGHYKIGMASIHAPLNHVSEAADGSALGVTGRTPRHMNGRLKAWILFDQMLLRHGKGIDSG